MVTSAPVRPRVRVWIAMIFTLSGRSRRLRYLGTVETLSLTHAESIVIARSPADLYDMISDVTRMGEWSPVCKACWWDDGSGPAVGSWFTGRNELAGRDPWETRSQVVAASPGEEFAFMVGGTLAR